RECVEGTASRSKVGHDGDLLGVRPYRRVDAPRRIHWGQTARYDRLIVCELQSNARPLVQVVLDADPAMHAGDGPHGSREWAVRVAASLCEGWLEQGAEVMLVLPGRVVPADGGRRQRRRVLDALARLPDDARTPLAELLALPECRSFEGVQV